MSDTSKYYHTIPIMRSKDVSSLRIIDLWKFKSTKSNKWYIVEMEHFDNNLVAVKFYPKAHRLSKNRYSILTNDYEPRTIVNSCLFLMYDYFKKDKTLSFGFIAASDMPNPNSRNRVNRRFRFYRRMVNNFFGDHTFIHLWDNDERVYLLVNRSQVDNGELSPLELCEQINSIYNIDFNSSWD